MRQAARLPLRSGLLVWLAAAAAADASPRVPEALAARAAAGEPVRVIVELAVPASPDPSLSAAARLQQRGRIGAAQDALSRELAGVRHRMTRRYRTLPFAALEVDAAGLAALARSPFVASVAEDRLHAPTLDVSGPLVEADDAHALGFDGSGQTVVVLDTGVDAAHPHLSGQLVDEACFADGTSPFPPGQGDCPNGDSTMFGPGAGSYCTYADLCFHGTHVAAIAASAHFLYSGIAPGAGLISIQVFSEFSGAACGSLPSPCPLALASDLIAALEYVYDPLRLVHAIPAVNLSLGGDTYTTQSACDAANGATKAAIDNLHGVGIATVIAAGNDGYPNAISEPACISSAVSVGATDDLDQVTTFTNAASFLSLWAPGKSIKAALYQTTSQANASGTSQAAPHVSGAFAVLRQADPSASPDDLVTLLQDTGVPIPHANANTSRIRVLAALDALLPDCDDGQDNDADGVADLADPGCIDALDDSERGTLQCDDGTDNDGDLQSDFPADPHCWGPWDDREAPSQCGLGAELAPLLGLLGLLRQRRARRARHA